MIAATAFVVFFADGGLNDIGAAFTSGPQRILSTDWPSPRRPELVGTVEAILTALVSVAAILASRPRFHLLPLVPLGLAYGLVVAASAPADPHVGALVALVALGGLFALLRPGSRFADRVAIVRADRWVPVVLAVAVMAAGALGGTAAIGDRADPRRNDPAESTQSLLDPIEATLALQALEDPLQLHDVTVVGGSDVPRRWRTAALAIYDGRRWAPDLILRPIGRRLATEESDAIRASITFLVDDVQLVPLPGPAYIVDAEIETDEARSLVRLVERPEDASTIEIVSGVDRSTTETGGGLPATREIDESVSGLTDYSERLLDEASPDGVPGTQLEQLRRIESFMASEFLLDTDASGGGLQRALIDRFLRDTRRGNREQFVTGFVLIARSLGIDARVATGFEVPSSAVVSSGAESMFPITSADATLWPEVRVGDAWVAFDPVPDREASDLIEDPPDPQTQAPAAPQPPAVEPPDSGEEPVVSDEEEPDAERRRLPGFVELVIRVAAGIGLLLVPLLVAVLLILLLKRRQRRRRLAGTPVEQISGAWAVATNRLVDAGMVIRESDTNGDIAGGGVGVAPSADRELARLSTLASAATFGRPARADLLADDAMTCLDEIESSIGSSRTRWQRWRWKLSTRSLRRSTRSPV